MSNGKVLAERYDAGTNDEYHAGEGTSHSMAKVYVENPYKYWLQFMGPERVTSSPTPSMIFGTAVHELALEGEYKTVRPIPDEIANLTGKGSRTAATEWKQANPATHYLNGNDHLAIAKIIAEIKAHSAANKLIFGAGESEVAIRGTDQMSGLKIRCKLDRMITTSEKVMIADIKTTTDASPKAFASTIEKFGYYTQAAFYCRLTEMLTGIPTEFYFVAVETGIVPRVEVYQIDEEAREDGERELFDDESGVLVRIAESMRTGNWRPSHHGKVLSIGRPGWAKYKEEYQV